MRIQTKVVYNWNERLGKYILVETDGYDYLGTVFACKGASSQQTGIANSQQNFMNTLQQDFGTAFSGQQNILNSLTSNLTGILNAGPSQYGFSAPEESALNTLATSGNAQQYANAKAAAGQAAAAAGGGNAVIPTSAASQQQAGIAEAGAQTGRIRSRQRELENSSRRPDHYCRVRKSKRHSRCGKHGWKRCLPVCYNRSSNEQRRQSLECGWRNPWWCRKCCP
jgi:hypothetical protein